MINPPCKDCPNREVGCHSNCEDYQKYWNWRRELDAERLQATGINNIVKANSRKTYFENVRNESQ